MVFSVCMDLNSTVHKNFIVLVLTCSYSVPFCVDDIGGICRAKTFDCVRNLVLKAKKIMLNWDKIMPKSFINSIFNLNNLLVHSWCRKFVQKCILWRHFRKKFCPIQRAQILYSKHKNTVQQQYQCISFSCRLNPFRGVSCKTPASAPGQAVFLKRASGFECDNRDFSSKLTQNCATTHGWIFMPGYTV